MGKLASFLAGVISGAVALGVTACLVEKHDCATSTNSSCEDEEEEAKQAEQTEETNISSSYFSQGENILESSSDTPITGLS